MKKYVLLVAVVSLFVFFTNANANTVPTISYIAPTSAMVGATVYIYGANFNQSTYVAWDGAYGQSITPTLISATSLSFVVPSSASIGTHTIQVTEKASSFPLSNSFSLTVIIPASAYTPTISYISPSSVVAGGTVIVYGSNFDQSSYVVLDSTYPSIVPSYQTATSLIFNIPLSTIPGSHKIQVGVKASPLSNSVSLTIIATSITTPVPTPPVNPNKPLPADVDTQNPQGACLDLQNNLRYRSRDIGTNDEVSALQDFLQANGYLNSEPTGFFGVLTLKAVKDFQQANGISPTGFIGPITRAEIKSLTCRQ